ncbi:hypothetical protein NDU88_000983 [Pleurodeles waltl]|uniref:Uncharacterized protein n=1 Tax=Pleurodeles waltl TaxID=8319 RepID=A0AAV7Q1U1_PLEWA|nr:hypothetical protein NDU88_000983 [Pleurodeles waltl]
MTAPEKPVDSEAGTPYGVVSEGTETDLWKNGVENCAGAASYEISRTCVKKSPSPLIFDVPYWQNDDGLGPPRLSRDLGACEWRERRCGNSVGGTSDEDSGGATPSVEVVKSSNFIEIAEVRLRV